MLLNPSPAHQGPAQLGRTYLEEEIGFSDVQCLQRKENVVFIPRALHLHLGTACDVSDQAIAKGPQEPPGLDKSPSLGRKRAVSNYLRSGLSLL